MRFPSPRSCIPYLACALLGLMACDAAPEPSEDSPPEPEAEPDGAPEPAENMLLNAGFEVGEQPDGCPLEWVCRTYRPEGAGAFSTTAARSYRDQRAAQWSADEGTPGTVIKQGHPSAEGRRYEVAAWYRSEGMTEAPYVQVLFHDASGAELAWESFEGQADPGAWSLITGATAAAPPGTARVQINLSTDGTPGSVWWDEVAMVDVTDPGDGTEPPPAEYEVIPAQGQTISISDGEVFENKLIDFTTGGHLSINARNATNWTIRNVGFMGRKTSGGTLFGVSDSGGGTSVMENIYMADGSNRNGGQPTCSSTSNCTHGPVGIFVGPEHSGHLVLRNINVQGWPNNGIYASAPGSNGNGQRGTVVIERSLGANNYVSSFRIAGGAGNEILDSVAYNDAGGGYDGRPIWVWKPGPIRIRGAHLDRGSFAYALVAGANGDGTTVILEDSQVRGPILEAHGSTVERNDVGAQPDLTPPEGVPLSAEEAASGTAGH